MKIGAALARQLVRDIARLPEAAQFEAWRRVVNQSARAGLYIGLATGAALGATIISILCAVSA